MNRAVRFIVATMLMLRVMACEFPLTVVDQQKGNYFIYHAAA